MITRREVDEFILNVMQRAFLALRESNMADENRTVLAEMQQAMQLVPAPITNATPLTALQSFLQYGKNDIRKGSPWLPMEPALDAMWRNLAVLSDSDLSLVAAGGSLLNFACLQEVEMRRLRRRDEAEERRLAENTRALAAGWDSTASVPVVAMPPANPLRCDAYEETVSGGSPCRRHCIRLHHTGTHHDWSTWYIVDADKQAQRD